MRYVCNLMQVKALCYETSECVFIAQARPSPRLLSYSCACWLLRVLVFLELLGRGPELSWADTVSPTLS